MRGGRSGDKHGAAPWRLFRHATFYQAGLPFGWYEQVHSPDTVAALQKLTMAEQSRDRLRERLYTAVREADTPQTRAACRKIRRLLAATRPVPAGLAVSDALAATLPEWAAALDRCARLQADAAAEYHRELGRARQVLGELAAHPTFREAVATSNPGFAPAMLDRYVATVASGRWDSHARHVEAKVVAYLQRITSKTHVSSLLGLVGFTTVDPGVRGVHLEVTPGGAPARRETFVGYWVVAALADAIGRDPHVRPYLRPAPGDLAEVDQAGRVRIDVLGARFTLSPAQHRFLNAVDGRRRVTEIAGLLGIEVDEALRIAGTLTEAGLLRAFPSVPVTLFHPLAHLRDQVADLPDTCARRQHWADVLDALEARRATFAAGDVPTRMRTLRAAEELFTAETGVPPRRNGGRTYGDRILFYEECQGPVTRFSLGPDVAARIEESLRGPLDLCAAYGAALRDHYQALAVRAFAAVAPDGDLAPFTSIARAMASGPPAGEPDGGARLITQRFRELVAERTRDGVADLTPADLGELTAIRPGPAPAAHAAVDLFVAASSPEDLATGRATWVMGEIGENVMPWGSQIYFHPDRDAVLEEVAKTFAENGYPELAIIVPERRHKGMLNDGFGGTFVTAQAEVGRAHRRMPLRDLRVRRDRDRVWLEDADGTPLRFFHHHDDKAHLWAFAAPRMLLPPLAPAPARPRVVSGRAVLLRAEWDVTAAEWPAHDGDFACFRAVRRWQAARGIPDRVFARFPGEIKPYCIDLGSAVSVAFMAGTLRRAGRAVLSEMLPGPDGLWLRDGDDTYCTELRTLLTRGGPDGS